ncbi:helix-turn-helix transcriptional regulator [Succinatimonas hippei]|uniref:helix-turn-helix transcriptional regulator n=1 Tax=Succinatimonas hippei TaxID=626938 RepID=UPI00255CDED8|nr:AraC family transcriptional regulator [Succinatimonas hippei]
MYFRIIISPLGNFLRHFYKEGTPSNQIAKAIKFLKDHFKEEININDLSDKIHMSPSAFFRNFSKVTGTTPLQYQKQLRLYEAQRILLQQDINTQKAAFLVGYKSANQFCRDYKKLFGNPPKTNIKLLSA